MDMMIAGGNHTATHYSKPKDLGTHGTVEDEKIRFLTDMSYERQSYPQITTLPPFLFDRKAVIFEVTPK